MCVCVLFSTPLVFIAGRHGVKLAEPPSAASEEMTCGEVEAVGPTGQVGRPGRLVCLAEAPTAPSFVQQAVLGLLVLTPWVLTCPKLVCLGAWAYFDPIEPDSCSLIGCAFCLDLWSVFSCS